MQAEYSRRCSHLTMEVLNSRLKERRLNQQKELLIKFIAIGRVRQL